MNRRGRYYLGRVVKLGTLNQPRLLDAIRQATIQTIGKFTWTITDIQEGNIDGAAYIFGKLSKYAREGHVTIVDSKNRSQVEAIAPNLLMASSPFVYMPDYSGIAHLHVWNGIQQDLFVKRFKAIIEGKYDNFFVDCTIEAISDYRSFAAKLSGIDRFIELTAKVHPPNPLFGRCWTRLNDYIKTRNADEVSIRESKEDGAGLGSKIIELVTAILDDPQYEPDVPPDITDAALLMAADGYGTGKVVGYESESLITIRTSDTQKSFLFQKDPNPELLAEETNRHLLKVNHERNMKHHEK